MDTTHSIRREAGGKSPAPSTVSSTSAHSIPSTSSSASSSSSGAYCDSEILKTLASAATSVTIKNQRYLIADPRLARSSSPSSKQKPIVDQCRVNLLSKEDEDCNDQPDTVLNIPESVLNSRTSTTPSKYSNSITTTTTSVNNNNNNPEEYTLLSKSSNNSQTFHNSNNNHSWAKNGNQLELSWHNLNYDVKQFKWTNLVKPGGTKTKGYTYRRLLDSISGSFRSGEFVAIMGPSGAGKTTLIECISGRRKLGVSGDILVKGCDKRTRLSYQAQDDSLMPCLTVYETLLFASKLRNYQRNNRLKVKLVDDNDNVYNATTYPDSDLIISLQDEAYHRNLVNSIIQKLGMDVCRDVRAESCSGGQQKRLSIALELIHSPTILILDEPTSGLDSVSCLQCVTLLRDLAHNQDQPMAIAASIHQPTARILQNFDRLYVIAKNGQCMYDGPTDQLVSYLSKFGVACPTYHNPGDFVVEIASYDYGTEVTRKLVQAQRERYSDLKTKTTQTKNNCLTLKKHDESDEMIEMIDEQKQPCLSVADKAVETSFKTTQDSTELTISTIDDNSGRNGFVHGSAGDGADTVSIDKICKRSRRQVKRREVYKTWILYTRCFKLSIRDPTEYLLRTFACFSIILLNIILYYDSHIGEVDGCSQDSLLHLLEAVKSDYNSNQSFSVADTLLDGPGAMAILNFGFVFFAILFVAFLSMMPVILTFPMEVGVFYKEYFNGWYSFSTYFLAKNFTNLLPAIVLPVIFGASAYYITGQIWEPWRCFYFITILVLVSLVADGVGIAISALFVHNVNAASIFAAISQIPMLLFTGLLVQINTLPRFIQPLTYLSYYRLCFESALITLYGYNRCHKSASLDMKQLRRLMGDDVEEVVDCVWTHSSFLPNSDDSSKTSSLSGNFLANKLEQFSESMEKQNPSLIMQNFNLSDSDLHFEMAMLAVYALVARIIAYIVLYRKANSKK